MGSSRRSTLFPYTTLFRSEGTRGSYRLLAPIERLAVPASVQAVLAARIDRLPEREKDRKSTRLNSSHTVISYAVFCLKKNSARICVRGCCRPYWHGGVRAA